MIKLLTTGIANLCMNCLTIPKELCLLKGIFFLISRDHNGHRDADIKEKVIDYLLNLMLKSKK